MISQIFIATLIAGCTCGVVAASLGLIRQVARFFDFSHAAVYTAAAYVMYSVAGPDHFPPVIAFVVSIAAAATLALLLHRTLYRVLRLRQATPEVMLLASVSVLLMVTNTVAFFYSDATRAIRADAVKEGLPFFAARVTLTQIAIVATSLVAYVALYAVIRFTRWGLVIRATAADPELARIRGIDVDRVITLTVVLASLATGAIGIMNAYDTDLTPLMGFNILLLAAVAVIAGGVGSLFGSLVAGFLVAGTQQVAARLMPIQWQDTVVFIILIVFVLFRPNGLLGKHPARVAM